VSGLGDRLRDDRHLRVAAVAGFVLRVGWLLVARPVPVSDFASYRKLARDILHFRFHSEGIPTARRTPGYPAVLALGSVVSNSPLFLGLVNCVLSAALIVAVAYAARAFGLGDRARRIAIWATALNPTFVFYAAVLGSENLQLPLLVTGTALALSRRDASGRAVVAGFAVLGAATLVRAESAVFVAVVLAILLARRVPLLRIIALGATAVALVMPWVIRNEIQVGRGAGIASTAGENFYFAHGQEELYGSQNYGVTDIDISDEVERSKEGWRLAWKAIGDDPTRVWRDAIRGTQGFFGWPDYAVEYSTVEDKQRVKGAYPATVSDGVYDLAVWKVRAGSVVLLASTAAAIAIVGVGRRRPLVPLICFIGASWFVTAVVFFGKSRFRLAAEPYMIMLVAGALFDRVSMRHSSGPEADSRLEGAGRG
jgi:hypothetical protein